MKNSSLSIFVLLIAVVISSTAATGFFSKEWNLDRSHSSVNFEIRHFFTPVSGQFDDFSTNIVFDPENLAESSIEATIHASSINTKNERRDGDLVGENFFDVENFPTLSFRSSSIEMIAENEFVAKGELTIKDVTKEFNLPFKLLGVTDHPFRDGLQIAGISSTFAIDRSEFGVGTGNWVSDAVISHDVTVTINLELNAQK